MAATAAPMITLTGFFTSQDWLRGKTLPEIERLLGYGPGRLSTQGAAVYAFTRIPEDWEFEVAGYTNVSGGMKTDPSWDAADKAAAAYYQKTGLQSSQARLKTNARATMTVNGSNRLIKVKPLLDGNSYPPGLGIPQWRVSDAAARQGTLSGILLFVVEPGTRYP
jgi:hypothetical protein